MKSITISGLVLVLLAVWANGCKEEVEECAYKCFGECVDTTNDPNNCGDCQNVCPAGSVCEMGTCQCPDLEESCGGQCIDVGFDVENCGGCGVLCAFESQCTFGECDVYLDPFGTLDVSFTTGWIFDSERWTTDMDYVDTHFEEGVTYMGAAFVGSVDSGEVIPAAGTARNLSFALHYASGPDSSSRIEIEQISYEDDIATVVMDPKIKVVFVGDDIQVGELEVDADDLAEVEKPFVYVTLALTEFSDCVLAVGSAGTLTISVAENTSAVDGGTLEISADGLRLFHPTDTPFGDVSVAINAKGLLVCQL